VIAGVAVDGARRELVARDVDADFPGAGGGGNEQDERGDQALER